MLLCFTSDFMKILVLDTAASICAATIYDTQSNEVLGECRHDIGKGHAEVLMDYVGQAVKQAGMSMAQLDRIAVNIGPGSFTGVRIGVAAARGFALALKIPAVGVSAFLALAAEVQDKHKDRAATILFTGHRGELYVQSFAADQVALTQPMTMILTEAVAYIQSLDPSIILAGSAAESVNEALGNQFETDCIVSTSQMQYFARIGAGLPQDALPKPLYMRGPDAKPQSGFALPRC